MTVLVAVKGVVNMIDESDADQMYICTRTVSHQVCTMHAFRKLTRTATCHTMVPFNMSWQ